MRTVVQNRSRVYYLVLAAVAAAVVFAGVALYTAVRANRTDIDDQQLAVRANCEVTQSIIDAGLAAIRSGILLPGDRLTEDGTYVPGDLTKSLGPAFPSYPERVKAADKAAAAYEDGIAKAATRSGGGRTSALTDNRLDCRKLAQTGD